jgi:hypothetical protein
MEKTIIDVIGWTGTILYLIAYGMVSAKKVEADSWAYQGMNFVAGTMLIINTLYLQAYPSVGIECRLGWDCSGDVGKKSTTKVTPNTYPQTTRVDRPCARTKSSRPS